MINLLPINEKKSAHKIYIVRVSITFLVFLLVSIFAGVVFLFPSILLIRVKGNSATELVSIARETISRSEGGTVAGIARKVNEKLTLLVSEEERHFLLSPVFKKVLNTKTQKLKITGLFYKQGPNNDLREEKIIVRGRSVRREELLSFVKALQTEPLFVNVDLPISDLVESEDIPFSITITFSPELLSVGDETLL